MSRRLPAGPSRPASVSTSPPSRRRPRKRDWVAAAIAVMVVAALVISALSPFLFAF